jgi:rSAM/selenodomain-associated transferase 2
MHELRETGGALLADPPALSVIIPALEEAATVGATVGAALRACGGCEVIVIDGGSRDATAELARAAGARVLVAARGRGAQMHAGALAARGRVLWFLHADTAPPEGAARLIAAALADARTVGGNFAVRFGGSGRAARFMTWLYPRLRALGLLYGDSAIFVRRDAYERAGGFRPFPVFEDLDFVRRLRRAGRLAHIGAEVVTSSRRFEGRSFAPAFARWVFLQLLYWAGVRPHALGRLYAPVRGAESGGGEDELLRGRRSREVC